MQHSLDLICAIDKKGDFIFISDACERILGYSSDELTGKNFSAYVCEEDLKITCEIANSILSGKGVTDFENRYRRKDGTLVDLMWSAKWDPEQEMMYCVARDITEFKKAQSDLKRINERFLYAAKATLDAVWEWDFATNQLYWSENYTEMLGYPATSANGHISTWYIHLHPLDCERVVKGINKAIEGGDAIWTDEYRYKKSDGSYLWVTDRGIVLKNTEGKPVKMIGAIKDISVQKKAEEELLFNEQRFRSLVQGSSDLTAIINVDGDYIYVSPSVEFVLGYPAEHFLGKNAFSFIHPDDIETALFGLKSINEKKFVTPEPFRFQNSNGEWRWIETRLSNELSNPCVNGIVANSRDITEKKRTDDQLKMLALLAKQTLNPVVVTDTEQKITWVNDAFIRTYGYSMQELIGQMPKDVLSGPETSVEKLGLLQKMLDRKETFSDEIKYYTKDRRKKIVEFQTQPLHDERGAVTGFFSIHHDITEKRKLERKLVKEHKERERRIAEAIIVTQEKERSEIASELHDNVNQLLTTVKLYLELIQTDKEGKLNLIEKSIDLIMKAIREIRGISHTLSYVSARDMTLEEALTGFVDMINLAGKTKVILHIGVQDKTIGEGIKLSIYRIVQEQMNNILKYANATNARIEISQCEKNLTLEICDNGIGFDPCHKKTGIGLSNIETRVLAFSGKMDVKSSPGNGCFLHIEFPINGI